MKPLKTNDQRVLEVLKKNGMPDSCMKASIVFEPGDIVRVVFECAVSDASADDLSLLISSQE